MKGKIYFVSAPGRIKIGYTKKPEVRLAQLRSVDMEQLEVIGIADGSMHIEHRLHKMVLQHCIRGEWFRDCAEVRTLAADYLNGILKFDEYGEEIDEASSRPSNGADFMAAWRQPVTDSIAEAERLLIEIEDRVGRGEPVSDLVRAACFLAKHVIAPRAGN